MDRRLELHDLLCSLLGSRNVYFQPPETVKIKYPCIIYRRNRIDTEHASNRPYKQMTAYQIIVIDSNPDSEIPGKIGRLPLSRFENHYTADNLNHDVYNVYY